MIETVIRATRESPRLGEGDVLVLRGGRLLLAYTEFYGGASDFSPARIVARVSENDGATWSEPFVLQENVGKCNVMCATLLRLRTGEIAFFYGVKNSFEDLRFYVRKSEDEGETWSEPRLVTVDMGYFVMNNDRAVQLSSGRVLAPVSTYQDPETHSRWKSLVYYSDDDCETWRRGGEVRLTGDLASSRTGLQEPGIVELRDGTLMMYMRTALGYIYACHSDDEGETWSEPEPLDGLKAPTSPATIKRVPSTGDLLLVWNDKSDFDLSKLERHGVDIVDRAFQRRAPLSCAVSRDEGETWEKLGDIEPAGEATYCYPSITFKGGLAIITYYYKEGGSSATALSHLKVRVMDLAKLLSAQAAGGAEPFE